MSPGHRELTNYSQSDKIWEIRFFPFLNHYTAVNIWNDLFRLSLIPYTSQTKYCSLKLLEIDLQGTNLVLSLRWLWCGHVSCLKKVAMALWTCYSGLQQSWKQANDDSIRLILAQIWVVMTFLMDNIIYLSVNPLWPSNVMCHNGIESTFTEAIWLFGSTKPSPEPMLTYLSKVHLDLHLDTAVINHYKCI